MDVQSYNRSAWDKAVERGSQWTIPVGPDVIAAARRGEWSIILTPEKPVPRDWFPAQMAGARILCLASGGGQQGPTLAATGADVTVFDNSPRQLAQDRLVAAREGLTLHTVEGDMADLSCFDADTFDLIVHPCSNLFVPDVRPVWHAAYHVLRPGGTLISGFMNPAFFIFDTRLHDEGKLLVRHKLPYSDLHSLDENERRTYIDDLQPLEYSHTLEDQIGGQLDAGFVLTGFYEDGWEGMKLAEHMSIFVATRALKLDR